MTDKLKTTTAEQERRDFLKKAGKVAVTAPAVALLLTAGAKKAAAGGLFSGLRE